MVPLPIAAIVLFAVGKDFSQKEIARRLGVTPSTVSKWVSDITEHHRDVLKVRALVLRRLGLTLDDVGEQLGRPKQTISDWLSPENGNGNFPDLTEELIEEAIAPWPDESGEIAATIEDLREEMIFGHWSQEERDLLEDLRDGQ